MNTEHELSGVSPPAQFPHLGAVDPAAWPRVARVPTGALMGVRASWAEARFARACANAGLSVDVTGEPDLRVEHDALFARLAHSGWLGLAEGYLAGEWTSENLTEVLGAFLRTGYQPQAVRRPFQPTASDYSGGELPAELVRLSSGDGMSMFPGVFASGVPTTVRTALPSFAPGAKQGSSTHFVDLTTLTDPLRVEREDLSAAQGRTAAMLLDIAQVRAGTHLLEFPSSGGAVALAASARRATVDTLTADPAQARAVQERLTFAGVNEAVHTAVLEEILPFPQVGRGQYDAIISVDKLEYLPGEVRGEFVRNLDRLLSLGGHAALQVTVATDGLNSLAQEALGALRAYIWPSLKFPSILELHKLVDRDSGLRITAQTHVGNHAEQSLRLQEALFAAQHREAAAAGFDITYRRLWKYHFALKRALLRLGMIDVVQLELSHRHRQGRR